MRAVARAVGIAPDEPQGERRDPQRRAREGHDRPGEVTWRKDSGKQSFLTDVKTLRERARKHIEQGAVTPGYRADARP